MECGAIVTVVLHRLYYYGHVGAFTDLIYVGYDLHTYKLYVIDIMLFVLYMFDVLLVIDHMLAHACIHICISSHIVFVGVLVS